MNKTLITTFACLVFGALPSVCQISASAAIKADLASAAAKVDPPMPDCWPHCTPAAPVATALRADPPMPDCWPHCTPVAPVAIALRADPPMPDCWPHCKPAAPISEYFADLEFSNLGNVMLSFDRNPQI